MSAEVIYDRLRIALAHRLDEMEIKEIVALVVALCREAYQDGQWNS